VTAPNCIFWLILDFWKNHVAFLSQKCCAVCGSVVWQSIPGVCVASKANRIYYTNWSCQRWIYWYTPHAWGTPDNWTK